ncbi:MAG: aminotransferase class I/II-fold pyridoxal phosphate-dependent enzyme [Pseudomonadota bacterium]
MTDDIEETAAAGDGRPWPAAPDGIARDALLSRLRATHQQRAAANGDAATAPTAADRSINGMGHPAEPPPAPFDFATLPEYQQMRFQRAAAETMGLANPFFRLVGDAGPVAEVDGTPCLNFGSYDYLGLGAHPSVRRAAAEAVERHGISAGASRLVGGERPWHGALETALADFLGTEAALAMVSGHATNVTTIATLLGPKDLVLIDALIHNSISEGVQLSGATRRVYPHNDLGWIDDHLTRFRGDYRRVLIVTEGLFSMDGDTPDLAGFVRLKTRHDAWLMVDDAHGLGVLGATGRGVGEMAGIDPRLVDIWMGTLSKSLVSCGGYIAGSRVLIEFLKYRAPGFVFSVGLAAPVAAAATAALGAIRAEPERVARLAANGRRFLDRARAAGLDTGLSQGHAVTPVIVGDSIKAVRLAEDILRAGVHALPIIFPAVPERQARLRFFLSAGHTDAQIDRAVDCVAEHLHPPGSAEASAEARAATRASAGADATAGLGGSASA